MTYMIDTMRTIPTFVILFVFSSVFTLIPGCGHEVVTSSTQAARSDSDAKNDPFQPAIADGRSLRAQVHGPSTEAARHSTTSRTAGSRNIRIAVSHFSVF